MYNILAPDVVIVDRRLTTSQSTTGEPVYTTSNVYPMLPCLVDQVPVPSAMAGNIQLDPAGITYLATHIGFVQGVGQYSIPVGTSVGGTVSVGGIAYIVDNSGQAAFPDVQSYDRITDERGRVFLVQAVAIYTLGIPELQLTLLEGRTW